MDRKEVLIAHSHHGQYIPMLFAQAALENLFTFSIENMDDIREQLQALAMENANESFAYWDLFVEVEQTLTARFKDDPIKWRLHWIDNDLYLVRDDVEWDDMGFPTHWG